MIRPTQKEDDMKRFVCLLSALALALSLAACGFEEPEVPELRGASTAAIWDCGSFPARKPRPGDLRGRKKARRHGLRAFFIS